MYEEDESEKDDESEKALSSPLEIPQVKYVIII
jgi:hypothetical protein